MSLNQSQVKKSIAATKRDLFPSTVRPTFFAYTNTCTLIIKTHYAPTIAKDVSLNPSLLRRKRNSKTFFSDQMCIRNDFDGSIVDDFQVLLPTSINLHFNLPLLPSHWTDWFKLFHSSMNWKRFRLQSRRAHEPINCWWNRKLVLQLISTRPCFSIVHLEAMPINCRMFLKHLNS